MRIALVKEYIILLGIFISVLVFDQATKAVALNLFIQEYKVFPFLSFYLSFNHGISFGLFNSQLQNQIVFILISSIIVIALIWHMIKLNNVIHKIPALLIIAGAIGNIIDRIRIGAVIDFIYFYWEQYSFPIFNIADSAICIGCFLMCLITDKKQV